MGPAQFSGGVQTMSNHKIQLILVGLLSIAGTVTALHQHGYLRHSSESDALYIAEFSLLAMTAGTTQKMSAKPADFIARCEQGYLILDAPSGDSDNLGGVLVDQKKRPVTCR